MTSKSSLKAALLAYIDSYEVNQSATLLNSPNVFRNDFILGSFGAVYYDGKFIVATQDPSAFFAYYRNFISAMKDEYLFSWLTIGVHKSDILEAYLRFGQHFSAKQKGEFLRQAWVMAEFPSLYGLKHKFDFVKNLKSVNKRDLMDENEITVLSELPEAIVCYRGVFNKKFKHGCSYSLNFEQAKWFASRFGKQNLSDRAFLIYNNSAKLIDFEGIVYRVLVPKNIIVAYFNREEEVVVDVEGMRRLGIRRRIVYREVGVKTKKE